MTRCWPRRADPPTTGRGASSCCGPTSSAPDAYLGDGSCGGDGQIRDGFFNSRDIVFKTGQAVLGRFEISRNQIYLISLIAKVINMQSSRRRRIRSAAQQLLRSAFIRLVYRRGVVARPASVCLDRIVRVRTADVSRLQLPLPLRGRMVRGRSRDGVPPDAPADERRERFGVSHQRTFADTPIGHSHYM